MRHDEIVAKISELSETTNNLKSHAEKRKSRLDRFKEYAGVVSLVLSLATGSFTVYTSLVTDPEKSKADAQSKLQNSLAQIVTLDQEYLKELQQGDPSANNGTLQSKRNILLQQAEDLADQRDVTSAADELDLGNAYFFGGWYELALKHFKRAAQLAGKDAITKANAEIQLAKVQFYGVDGSSINDGRSSFDVGEKLLGKPAPGPADAMLVQLLAARSHMECSLGDPRLGEQAKQRALDELTHLARNPAINPQLIDWYKVDLTAGLSNTHCGSNTTVTPPAASVETTSQNLSGLNKIDLSNRMMALLVARDYRGFEENMTVAAQAQIPQSHLQSIWEQVQAITGPYKRTIETKTNIVNNTVYYIVHTECRKTLLNLALAFDPTNRVTYVLLTPLSALPKPEIERRAKKVVSDFFEQKFNDVYSGFDQNLRSQIPLDRLQAFFAQITGNTGAFDHVVGVSKDRDLDIVDVICQLQGGKVIGRVAYDPDMRINQFFVQPSK